MRVGIGGLWHETNTFAPGRTELADFVAYLFADGPEAIRDELAGTATEVGGALEACVGLGYEAAPFFYAGAVPGPTVSSSAWQFLLERLLARLEEALPVDGLVLALHGAMVAEDADDPEGDLLVALRERVGSIPIAVVLDLHANPGERLVEEADIALGYDTYPHVDAADRAAEAVRLMADVIDGELAPAVVGRRLPLLTCPLVQATDQEPMASLLGAVRQVEARPGIACASLIPGFAYADVRRLGFSVLATGEPSVASDAVEELAGAVWARRSDFLPELVAVDAAVERALGRPDPVVLAEVADNVGGGAPGNATHVLAALLAAEATGAVVVLHDPGGAAAAAAGGEVELPVGHPPVVLRGRAVRSLDARYRRTGSYMTGSEVDMGLCTVVEAGGVEVVLTSSRLMPFDSDHLRAVGIDPAERRLLVVKSAVAWRAAFGELAAEVIYVDTPGVCTCRLETLPYAKAPRPIAPLDP